MINKQVNFKEYFREDDLLSGNVLRLINETQENINTNNKKEVKKMKLKKETISVDINVEHYGFYHNDEHLVMNTNLTEIGLLKKLV
ncbi:hypothetical protein CMO95_00040 [Candidatus Woesearchaeota archaeon]|nr:hypothetical protein [Candidatus Woesearchaeota archaeon]